mgnify:CR=1 FL=1
MDALVHRLVSGPGARRKGWLLVGSIAVAMGLGAFALQSQDDVVECTGGAAEIGGLCVDSRTVRDGDLFGKVVFTV